MRRWLPHSLWFFAWAFWGSLGIGLYHELPRDLGQAFRKLPIGDCSLIAFVPDSKLAAFGRTTTDGNLQIVVFDAETGKSRETDLSAESNVLWMPNGNPLAARFHGIVFDVSTSKSPPSRGNALEVVDLRDGSRRTLFKGDVGALVVHTEHPWVALVELLGPTQREQRVLLLDFRSGSRLFEWPRTRVFPSGSLNLYEDSNCIAVPIQWTPGSATTDPTIRTEYWRLGETPVKVTWQEALGTRGNTDRPVAAKELPSPETASRPPTKSYEVWPFERLDWLRDWNMKTVSFRNSADGSLLCRVRLPGNERIGAADSAGTLLVNDDGSVYRLPPGANWDLLAVCQTILALPLVLTWLAVRWWRKRRLRLAGAAS
jgi:hypothetical protein